MVETQRTPHEMECFYMDLATSTGVLEVCSIGGSPLCSLEMRWSASAMDEASECERITVPDWWKNSRLELNWSAHAMDWTSLTGLTSVLDWWKRSGLELKYGHRSIETGLCLRARLVEEQQS
ncbi:hypothetical protein BJ742DRAFT_810103 [Cladochytrium replicatum]|nr:hypothetical protein BJ742DRAFT_810103 [Cladochytrium replicatum]